MDGFVYVRDGHLFESEPDNPNLKLYIELGDHHGGPCCMICKEVWCEHCAPDIYTKKCPGRDEPTLDGLEYRQPQFKGVVGRSVNIANISTLR